MASAKVGGIDVTLVTLDDSAGFDGDGPCWMGPDGWWDVSG